MSQLIDCKFSYTKSNIVEKIKIEISNLILFESCLFRVILFDVENNIIDIKFITLEGEEYLHWNNDDYITDYIKNKLEQS
jgi:hypothetical protein